MSTARVPNGTDKSEPVDPPVDFYTRLAETLRAVADDIAWLAGRGLPDLYASLTFQPGTTLPDEETVPVIDALGQALLDQPGETVPMSSGSYHHHVDGWRGGSWREGLRIQAYTSVTPPKERALQDEIARLTAERDRLAAEVEQRDERPEVES